MPEVSRYQWFEDRARLVTPTSQRGDRIPLATTVEGAPCAAVVWRGRIVGLAVGERVFPIEVLETYRDAARTLSTLPRDLVTAIDEVLNLNAPQGARLEK